MPPARAGVTSVPNWRRGVLVGGRVDDAPVLAVPQPKAARIALVILLDDTGDYFVEGVTLSLSWSRTPGRDDSRS
jgi:hypothetical protein